MPFTKIEAKDYDGKGVTGLPDIPRLDTLDMQKKFDELTKDVAIPKHNVLVDELSGETAADNLGIADDIADFSNPTKKIKPLLVTFAKKIKENSNDRHTHKNKTVLDSITDTAITAWNKVSKLFTNIDGVEDVVSGRTSKIPSSFAISQYVQQMGGGDMVQSIYDRNRNGIVDNAEALGGKAAGEYQTAESQDLQTTSKTVVGAVNEVFNKTKDVLNTKEEIEGNTDPTAIAGALSVKELSSDLSAVPEFVIDKSTGKIAGYKTKEGADTVFPFSSAPDEMIVCISGQGYSGSAMFSREFLDVIGYTKLEIHPGIGQDKKTKGISVFNAFSLEGDMPISDRIEYAISSVKTIDISSTSAYTKGVAIVQSGDGSTVSTKRGYVKFLKK